MKRYIAKGGATLMLAAALVCSGAAAASAATTHVVKDGDTFWKLSRSYQVPLDRLIAMNAQYDPLNLYGGLKLTIPDSAQKTAVANTNQTAQTTQAAKTVSVNGSALGFTKVVQAKASAYTAAAEENGGWAGLDYFGNALRIGTVAVDPSVIPLGSKLYITGYDYDGLPTGGMLATASDVGGAIKGNRVDLFVADSRQKALTFGYQYVKVYVLAE
ncbi:LysM peptidoglycan-binding domain-containing protein [Paenibacillus sp. IB182496]|uniref:LysM peptidoglycan-binding domain-containing protein n=1 Tax=Paenibacillus sabuli TaxID=2772509 RepID=A0A927BU21_9BACL|nr:3D domain-containing protein [Paenibacillus sabuli]MBD2845665.1 LysM peptidoglycan-binding domain-containing protein [Paenibacillus sabuli]